MEKLRQEEVNYREESSNQADWAPEPILPFQVFLAMLHGMCDLSSPTRDRTLAPALEAPSLNHWTAREVPEPILLTALLAHCFWAWRWDGSCPN